ncbi:MAG: choice-of-anchor R domain-containing protein, partial [Terriglobia bacterium]
MLQNYKLLLPLASLTLLMIGGFAPALRADTEAIFSNVDTTTCGCGVLIANSYSVAEEFTPAADDSLTAAEARLNGVLGGGTVNFALYSDSSGLPGASLGQLGSVAVSNTQEGLFTVNAPAPLDLMANIPYWLVLTPGTSSTDVIWEGYASSYVPGASGVSAWTKEPALTNLQFRIDGTPVTPVPEPASAGLLL